MVQAKDIMSRKVITITENETLKEAIDLLTTHRFGGLPVVDEEGLLKGAINITDIVQYAKKIDEKPLVNLSRWFSSRSEDVDMFYSSKSREAMKKALVKEAMTENIITAGEEEPMQELAKMMKRHRTNRIHIVDEEGQVVGIVTRSDIVLGISKPQ